MKLRHAIFFLLLTLPASILKADGEQPPYDIKDPVVAENFRQAFLKLSELELRITAAAPPVKTKAELAALTPTAPGLPYYCSDCATDGIVVSTGTTRGAFGRISARGTAVN